jgi:hypothetical protein
MSPVAAQFAANRRLGGIGPRQEFIDTAVGMAVDDLGDHVGEVGCGSTPLSLQVSIIETISVEV